MPENSGKSKIITWEAIMIDYQRSEKIDYYGNKGSEYLYLIIFAALFNNLTIMLKAEIVKEESKSTGIEATTVIAVVEGGTQ